MSAERARVVCTHAAVALFGAGLAWGVLSLALSCHRSQWTPPGERASPSAPSAVSTQADDEVRR